MLPELRDLGSLADRPDGYWNEAIGTANDHEVRLAVMTETFFWHCHPDSDEIFIGVEGELEIAFEDGVVVVGPGQLVTVPKGVVHRTRAITPRSVNLTVERRNATTVRVHRDD